VEQLTHLATYRETVRDHNVGAGRSRPAARCLLLQRLARWGSEKIRTSITDGFSFHSSCPRFTIRSRSSQICRMILPWALSSTESVPATLIPSAMTPVKAPRFSFHLLAMACGI